MFVLILAYDCVSILFNASFIILTTLFPIWCIFPLFLALDFNFWFYSTPEFQITSLLIDVRFNILLDSCYRFGSYFWFHYNFFLDFYSLLWLSFSFLCDVSRTLLLIMFWFDLVLISLLDLVYIFLVQWIWFWRRFHHLAFFCASILWRLLWCIASAYSFGSILFLTFSSSSLLVVLWFDVFLTSPMLIHVLHIILHLLMLLFYVLYPIMSLW